MQLQMFKKAPPPFKRGDRIQMHPATDRWMRGDKFAEVLSVQGRLLKVRFDRSGDVCVAKFDDVLEVIQ